MDRIGNINLFEQEPATEAQAASRPSANTTSASLPKRSAASEVVIRRLMKMADLRQARIPEHIDGFAAALASYPYDMIDKACSIIEQAERVRGEPAFPEAGRILSECRHVRTATASSSNVWTVERYAEMKMFDDWMREEIAYHNKTQEQIFETRPAMGRAWLAWKHAIDMRTMDCPGWCDKCKGVRWIIRKDEGGESFAQPCYACCR